MQTPIAAEGAEPLSPETLGQDAIGRIVGHWYDLAERAGGVPPRAYFDPAAIPDLLPQLIIVEHLGGQDFRYRLLGTEVERFARDRYTGRCTSQIPGHGPGNRIHALYVSALECQKPVGMRLPYVGTYSTCTSARQVALPFRRGELPDQVISLIDFEMEAEQSLSPSLLAVGRLF